MPGRKSINLEPFKIEIIRIFQSVSIESVIQYLQHHHQLQVKRTTIKNWLRRWEIRKLNQKVTTDAELHARIKVLFYQVGLEEKDMITVLHQDGYYGGLKASSGQNRFWLCITYHHGYCNLSKLYAHC